MSFLMLLTLLYVLFVGYACRVMWRSLPRPVRQTRSAYAHFLMRKWLKQATVLYFALSSLSVGVQRWRGQPAWVGATCLLLMGMLVTTLWQRRVITRFFLKRRASPFYELLTLMQQAGVVFSDLPVYDGPSVDTYFTIWDPSLSAKQKMLSVLLRPEDYGVTCYLDPGREQGLSLQRVLARFDFTPEEILLVQGNLPTQPPGSGENAP